MTQYTSQYILEIRVAFLIGNFQRQTLITQLLPHLLEFVQAFCAEVAIPDERRDISLVIEKISESTGHLEIKANDNIAWITCQVDQSARWRIPHATQSGIVILCRKFAIIEFEAIVMECNLLIVSKYG
jgi:hypothetical protein